LPLINADDADKEERIITNQEKIRVHRRKSAANISFVFNLTK
jgi:hypothetical protein